MTGHLLEFDSAEAAEVARAGGKLAGLARLTQEGLNVPAGFGVAGTAFREWLSQGGADAKVAEQLSRLKREGSAAAARIEAEVASILAPLEVPPAVASTITERYAQLARLLGESDLRVAVRSSATAEDSGEHSFAGEYATVVGCRGPEEVVRAVRECWLSMFGHEALAYAAAREIDLAEANMSVVIQSQVAAESAGVMFTISPITGDRSRIVIEASWGLGTAVVGGEVTPDRYVADKVSLEILEREIGDKAIEHDPDGVSRPVAEERRSRQALTDENIRRLAEMGKRLEKISGHPVDVEWAVDPRLPDARCVAILQCRPETTWQSRRPAASPSGKSALDMVTASYLTGPKAAAPRSDGEK